MRMTAAPSLAIGSAEGRKAVGSAITGGRICIGQASGARRRQGSVGQGIDQGPVVGGHDHRAAAVHQPRQQRQHLVPGAAVLAERRLVEDDGLRCRGQGGRDRKPPLLPARQGEGVRLPDAVEAQPLSQLRGALPRLRLGQAGPDRSEGKLVRHPAGQELVLGILEDRTDAGNQLAGRPAPDDRPGVTGREGLAGGDLTALRTEEAAEQSGERRFARAVGPDHGQGLRGPNGQVEPGEDRSARPAAGVRRAARPR